MPFQWQGWNPGAIEVQLPRTSEEAVFHPKRPAGHLRSMPWGLAFSRQRLSSDPAASYRTVSLQLQPPLLTLRALMAPTVAHVVLLPSATDLLAPSAQAALVERNRYFASKLIKMPWECHCSTSPNVQGVGYLDGFERNTFACAWEHVPCRYVLMDMIYFRKKKKKTQANVEPMIYRKQHCLEYKYRQAAYLLLMVLCSLG